jgi:hypothetical protein
LIFDSDFYCGKCGNKYYEYKKWCKKCQINQLKSNFANCWTSGNEKIDDFIQKMQLKINKYDDMIFEWMPYDVLIEIKEINGDNDFATAIWKDGHLYYDTDKKEWTRESYVKVYLNCLYSLQDFTDEVINKV